MGANYPGTKKRWVCAILALVLFIGSYIGIAVYKGATRGGVTFASENKTADANESRRTGKEEQKDANEAEVRRPDHNHPAFGERVEERWRLVRVYIEHPRWAPDVEDVNVIGAMRMVPRHAFVRKGDLGRAYADHPLPIGLGQTISQPFIVAYMTEVLKLDPNSRVLEVGKERLKKLGYHNVFVKAGDGYYGWEKKGPFDAIIVTCAAGFVPPPLVEQLKPGGRMILPRGSPYGSQWLVLVTKDDKGKVKSKRLMGVRFVPMTGRMSKSK
jgi:protein-L-isoaspartate(D-aspartate) O-methyltransferase